MKPSIDIVNHLACHGMVKYSGITSGSQPSWKSGSVVVNCNENGWLIEMYCTSSPRPLLSYKLDPTSLINVICQATLCIQLKTGVDYVTFYYRPANDKEKSAMSQLSHLLKDLKQNYASYEQKIPKTVLYKTSSSASENRISKSTSTLLSPISKFANKSPSPQKFTSPYNTGISSIFLQRGTDKAREHLETIGTNNFYNKTSTPAPSRHYGGFTMLSSVKRANTSLGLMPDPSPTFKKSRLSDDVPYTWSKKVQSQDTKQNQQQHFQGSLAKLIHLRKHFTPDQTKRDLLKNVKAAISSSAKRFSGYQQHDAHEFLGQVLDQLKEEVNKILKSTPSPHRDGTDKEYNTSHDCVNPTYQNFEFEVQHTITCTNCHENTCVTEQFNDLSVEMPKTRNMMRTCSIQEALDLFFRKETLEYTCEKCGSNKGEVTHKFTKLPRVLILHLKRYRYDTSTSYHSKVARNIHIPRFLTLQSHCVEETAPAFPAILLSDLKNYRFKRCTTDSGDSVKTNDQISRTPCKKLRYDDKKEEDSKDDCNNVMTIEDEMDDDPELTKVLELSLKEANDKVQNYTEEDSSLVDSELEKVLEMSRLENEKSVGFDHDYGKDLNGMSEEEQLRLAIEESLKETENFYPPPAELSTSTSVSSMDTDLSSSHVENSVNKSYPKNGGMTSEDKENKNLREDLGLESKKYLENYLFGPDEENNFNGEQNESENKLRNCDRLKTEMLHEEIESEYAGKQSVFESKKICDNNDKSVIEDNSKTSVSDHKLCLTHKLSDESSSVTSDQNRPNNDDKVIDLDTELEIENEKSESSDISNKKRIDIHNKEKKNADVKSSDVDNTISDEEILLFCNEDNDINDEWLSLENKENKKPCEQQIDNSITISDSDQDVDDTPLPKVENEKGDLPYSYRLISVVNHIGSSSAVGK
ncbi:hypothetical protein KUTeg_002172 [Tegillarca granosa]|uniref:USP domain-containing protein n=1 Tax=Tegillarca granosa TaxID=220873 RepID=A0ABQ9FTP1_TEGGR|nr:hypothetical protein KUTeg_002172 [Tegillarca granosa]